ncbi:MAG: copper chaperone PCu(A)C [Chloroflexi bacterium]|nr:copper chaperone PCu(A)C [Chloroflexota bacterium]
MKRILVLIFFIASLLTACQPQAEGEGVEAHDYWIRTAAQGENSALYMLLHNHATESDELLGVSSDIADAVEIHETTMDNDVMQMSPVASVILDPDAEVYFEPGGLHVMFIGLKQDLKAGDEVQVTLHFKNHEDIILTVPVQEEAGEMDSNH